jgi:leucine dehydrogenase
MTYKNVMAGLPAGGGKGVIIANARIDKTPLLLSAYGEFVERLKGGFVTGEDVGITVADMDIIAQVTAHVRGTSRGPIGDPSPYTAIGCIAGIRAAAAQALSRPDLNGLKVCIQGIGNVGGHLAEMLHAAGAHLTVADINADAVREAQQRFGAQMIAPDAAHAADVDVFAPCALGAVLSASSIPDIKAAIVAGSANNQLAVTEDGARLKDRGILYAPDYVINAGGIVALVRSSIGADALQRELDGIGTTLAEIFERARKQGRATSDVADDIAHERLHTRRAARQAEGSLAIAVA